MNHPQFIGLVGAWDRDVADFIIARFQEIFDHAFQIAEPYQKWLSDQCFLVLARATDYTRPLLFAQTPLLASLKDYVAHLDDHSFRSLSAYFSHIDVFCFDFGAVIPAFDDDRFWVSLFSHLYLDPVDKFIGSLFSVMRQEQNPTAPVLHASLGAIFKRIDLAGVLVRNFFHAELVRKRRSHLVFLQAIALDLPIDARGALLRDGAVPRLLWLAKRGRDGPTFDFFRRIAELGWRPFLREAVRNLDSLCAFVRAEGEFSRCDSEVVCLVAQIVRSAARVTDAYRNLIRRLTILFFKLPRHTGVHNGLVALLGALASVEPLRADFVQELRLFPLIVERTAARESDNGSSYWAHIAEIARLIDPLARKAGVDVARWEGVVMAGIREREAVIVAPYGGDVPRNAEPVEEEDSAVLPIVAGALVALAVIVTTVMWRRRRRS
jgi:hypothetical protein